MYEGCPADIQMIRTILEEGFQDNTVYHCEVIRYEQERERIYLVLEGDDLPSLSLDAVYECSIAADEEIVVCRGMVVQRYIDRRGSVVEFQIENGFYKNNLN